MATGSGLAGGRMSWAEAAAGPLAGATCLWQDLDGLHVEAAPPAAPPTSILWAWRGDSLLVRVRLDGQTAYVAIHDPAAQQPVRTVPWSPQDGRVAGSAGRGPDPAGSGTGATYEQVVLDADGGGPVTFVRPVVTGARPGRDA
jgi:hypothetical protein